MTTSGAAVLDYSAPLQDVQVDHPFGSDTVNYTVFDPQRGFVGGTDSTGSVSNLRHTNGVVIWNNGLEVFCRIYDPFLGQWMRTNVPSSGAVYDLQTAHGIVTWSRGSLINYVVYDASRAAWKGGSISISPRTTQDLRTAHGMVVWSTPAEVYCRAYDPVPGVWKGQSISTGAPTFNLTTVDGVAAWSVGSIVSFRTFDPTATAGWAGQNIGLGGGTSDLKTGGGIVAWSYLSTIYYYAYDPLRKSWRGGSFASGQTFNLTIQSGSVFWNAGSINYTRGYNTGTGLWTAVQTVPYAAFGASRQTGDAPLKVWLFDLSLGASTALYSWNFGDGQSSTRRSPYHAFTNYARNTVTLTVAGPGGGNDSAELTIITDITQPSGTVLINNGDTFTTNPAVTLSLSATDNSGQVAAMRFSNDNLTWTDWEPFAPARSWTLPNLSGTRTVFAQYRDWALNPSVSASDSILLDTSPPPLASFATNTITAPENANTVSFQVQLSSPFSRRVDIDYVAAGGTATAGADYTGAAGHLVFDAGETNQSFSLTIINDVLAESDETVILQLTNPTNAVVGPAATLTILDDDTPYLTNAFINVEGRFQATVVGSAGQRYLIQASTNLVDWVGFAIRTNLTGRVDFIDANTPSYPARFYRAQVSMPVGL